MPHGFATLLVLIVLAVGVVVALAYMNSASTHVAISENYEDQARVRYAAESGLDHGLQILRTSSTAQLQMSDRSAGTFTLSDTSAGSYTLRIQKAGTPSDYLIQSTGRVGTLARTASAVVHYSAASPMHVLPGVLVATGTAQFPGNVVINGDVQVNGSLVNRAKINGDVLAVGTIANSGSVTGSITPKSLPVVIPDIKPANYLNYSLYGASYSAVTRTDNRLDKGDALCNGGAMTAGNVAGVVYYKPSNGTLTIGPDVVFRGTVMVEGDLYMQGNDERLTSEPGFPVLVVTGTIYIKNSAHGVIFNGAVVAGGGIGATQQDKDGSLVINGPLISQTGGYNPSLTGQHTLNYTEENAFLYDFSMPGAQKTPRVSVVQWKD